MKPKPRLLFWLLGPVAKNPPFSYMFRNWGILIDCVSCNRLPDVSWPLVPVGSAWQVTQLMVSSPAVLNRFDPVTAFPVPVDVVGNVLSELLKLRLGFGGFLSVATKFVNCVISVPVSMTSSPKSPMNAPLNAARS